jgi:tyrosine-protein phosphatase OCA6
LDAEAMPMLVHCVDGANVTGLVVMCLRKIQQWHISSAKAEFCRYAQRNVKAAIIMAQI